MDTKKDYNSIDIKEGIFPRFWAWCKKQSWIFTLLGGIGVVFAGIQTYKACTAPDVAQQINKMLSSMQKEYEALKPVTIPDSLLDNKEIRLLKDYQDGFETYKLRLSQIDRSSFESKSDEQKRMFYYTRINQVGAYVIESRVLHEKLKEIATFESINTTGFIDCVDMPKQVLVDSLENAYFAELAANAFVHNKGKELQLTEEQVKKLYKSIDSLLGDKLLTLISEQDILYKNFYIQCSIRLKELLKQKSHEMSTL